MVKTKFKITLVLSLLLSLGVTSVSASSKTVSNNTILTLDSDASSSSLYLTAEDLLQLPQVIIKTRTRWTNGVVSFEGPLLRDVIALYNDANLTVTAIGINGYSAQIPADDFRSHNVILALKADDQRLTVRTKGPVWVIYPWTDNPAFESGAYYARAVWQLNKITVHD